MLLKKGEQFAMIRGNLCKTGQDDVLLHMNTVGSWHDRSNRASSLWEWWRVFLENYSKGDCGGQLFIWRVHMCTKWVLATQHVQIDGLCSYEHTMPNSGLILGEVAKLYSYICMYICTEARSLDVWCRSTVVRQTIMGAGFVFTLCRDNSNVTTVW